jgi:glutathione S-transferase
MKLYYHPLSGYSQKVIVAFYEKGLTFDGSIVELMDPEAKAAYMKDVYPIGKVPYLVADDGREIPESSIIIEYLENNYDSGARLIPDDKHLARQVRFHDRMSDLYLQNQIGTIFFDSMKPEDQRNPEAVQQARKTIDTVYGFLEKHLATGGWMVDNQFSMADCSLVPALNYARMTHPYEGRPNIEAYWDRLRERPSVKQVLDEAAPYMEAFMKNRG